MSLAKSRWPFKMKMSIHVVNATSHQLSLSTIMQRPSNHIIQSWFKVDDSTLKQRWWFNVDSTLKYQRPIKYHSQPLCKVASTRHETKYQRWCNVVVPTGMYMKKRYIKIHYYYYSKFVCMCYNFPIILLNMQWNVYLFLLSIDL